MYVFSFMAIVTMVGIMITATVIFMVEECDNYILMVIYIGAAVVVVAFSFVITRIPEENDPDYFKCMEVKIRQVGKIGDENRIVLKSIHTY
jgi:predicted membrane channel-forming protein YqfA (hemolysin III family)